MIQSNSPEFDSALLELLERNDMSQRDISTFLIEHWSEILRSNLMRVRQVISAGKKKDCLPPHVKEYCSIPTSRMNRLFNEDIQYCEPFLMTHVYLATHYDDVSCHQLLFGTVRPVEPFGKAAFFLTHFGQLSDAEQARMRDNLRQHPLITNNPSFVLRTRCEELSFSFGMVLRALLVFQAKSPTIVKKTKQFAEDDIPIIEKSIKGGIWNSNTIPAHIAYHLCSFYNVSADYLFLLDYSEYVQWQGSSLSPDLQSDLSLFLRATNTAQDAALQRLFQMRLNE